MKLHSKFALLDVQHGRRQLERIFAKGRGGYPANGERIPVTITGYITHQHGGDDGTSIEFGVEVTDLQAGDVEKP
jgi:hypothetical protein